MEVELVINNEKRVYIHPLNYMDTYIKMVDLDLTKLFKQTLCEESHHDTMSLTHINNVLNRTHDIVIDVLSIEFKSHKTVLDKYCEKGCQYYIEHEETKYKTFYRHPYEVVSEEPYLYIKTFNMNSPSLYVRSNIKLKDT